MSHIERRRAAIALSLWALALALSAQVDKRIALVVGNGNYQFNSILGNPPNDAGDMAAALGKFGFTVTALRDASRAEMERAIRDFGTALRDPSAVGLFFYAGHGVQAEGQNYLLPVDADIQAADELAYKAVDVEAVLAKMRSAGNRLNIVILDACRNNPFPGASRSAERGLAVVKVKVPESIIVYATDPGATAADGEGRNSPFTAAFLAQMGVPGQDISMMMKRVTSAVRAATGGVQSPWVTSNLSADFAFCPAVAGTPAMPLAPQPAAPVAPAALAAPAQPGQAAGPRSKDGFVSVPAGSFVMGSPLGERGRKPNEGPAHEVQLSAFEIGKYEVTFDEYDAFLAASGWTRGENDDKGWGRGRRPAINVCWYDAVAYCNWRSQAEGLKPAYHYRGEVDFRKWPAGWDLRTSPEVECDFAAEGYRLPTEAEWEYACRSGTATATAFGDSLASAQANFDGESGQYNIAANGRYLRKTMPVGSYKPNAWGIYDMHGNAAEWCWDGYDEYPELAQTDPRGEPASDYRVLRGGAFSDEGYKLRSAYRLTFFAGFRRAIGGFRLVRRPR